MNILLCTLGVSWAVIPEIYGFLAPERLDLYAHSPQAEALAALRARQALQSPDEIWVCTTEGEKTQQSIQQMRQWWALAGEPVPLRLWTAAGTDQLATQHECDHLRELILRLVLKASECCRQDSTTGTPAGQLVLSLAGGRKTMSADLQWAGSLFGSQAMLHVVGPEPLPEALRNARPETFIAPLPANLAGAVTPLVVDQSLRDELLDVELAGQTVGSNGFPLPQAAPTCCWPLPAEGCTLTENIRTRQRQGSQLLGNFIAQLGASESHENWRSLYRLPPARIAGLQKTPLSTVDRDWLQKLPKADLHRHLGGSLTLAAQRQVGTTVWQALSPEERRAALECAAPLLASTDDSDWDWNWPSRLKTGQRAANTAALLVYASDALLQRNLYDSTEPRLALKTRHPKAFAAYERPGELSGSAILGHPAALAPYAAALVAQAREEGLAYLELRGSPHKYRPDNPAAFVRELGQALHQAGANVTGDPGSPIIHFIWILDRRHENELKSTVDRAIAALEASNGFLVGLDLAGDESIGAAEQIAPAFTAAFRECLPITIHAGEGESADNIWQAAYHLHADRIGHGLSLADRPELASRFRNRGIALELCPTSNREVIGYRDPEIAASASYPPYPLRRFLELGLPLTLCTDNPGISRTTLADEFLTAARIGAGGLSHWEALALIKQSFVHSFLPAEQREKLLKRVDQAIYDQLSKPT